MNEEFLRQIKKKLIDMDKSFTWLAEQLGYTRGQSLRVAIKLGRKKAIQKVEEFLEIKAS